MKSQAEITEILKSRGAHSRGATLTSDVSSKLIATASDDAGVIRNGGRIGAGFAPKCIVHAYKRFAQGLAAPTTPIQLSSVCNIGDGQNFEHMQQEQCARLAGLLKEDRTHLVHIGGGHDHVYPLLAALLQTHEESIHVINVDAHLDTRTDDFAHSGTPFRQFAKIGKSRARITQIGIQDFANAASNWQDITMNVHRFEKMEAQTHGFTSYDQKYLDQLLEINNDDITLFSIDLDAIAGSEMPAVSAVNSAGLPLFFVRALLRRYTWHMDEAKKPRMLGLYEFNPLFDDVSGSAARTVAGLMHLTLQ